MQEAVVKQSREAAEADVIVGRRIRALRLEKNLSLTELAARTGISVGALSQIERGLSSLRVKVIWPLAAALSVEPSALIGDGGDTSNDLYCVRGTSRRSLPVHSEGIAKWLLSPPASALTGMLVTVEPGGGTAEAYAHSGHEFGYVLTGEIELEIDGGTYQLKQGDSFAFKSTLMHSFTNHGSARAEILWVNTNKPPEALDE